MSSAVSQLQKNNIYVVWTGPQQRPARLNGEATVKDVAKILITAKQPVCTRRRKKERKKKKNWSSASTAKLTNRPVSRKL